MADNNGTWDKVKGKTNEVVGEATDNESQELKGKFQQAKGDLKDRS